MKNIIRCFHFIYQDLRNISRFKNQTVIAIKAPPEAKLQVPHPSDAMQIYMKSDREEIEVFLCEDPPDEETGSSPMHATSPTKQGKLFNARPMILLNLSTNNIVLISKIPSWFIYHFE